jgi:hypothetical protein
VIGSLHAGWIVRSSLSVLSPIFPGSSTFHAEVVFPMVTFEWWSRCSCPSVLQSHAPHSPDPGPCRPSVDRTFAPGPVVCARRLRGQRPERFGERDREHAEPAVHQCPLPGHAALGYGPGESRMAIADWDSPNVWQQFSFPSVGASYTTEMSDVLAYQNAPACLARRDRPGDCAHPPTSRSDRRPSRDARRSPSSC